MEVVAELDWTSAVRKIPHHGKEALDRIAVGLHGLGHQREPDEHEPEPREDAPRFPDPVPLADHRHHDAGKRQYLNVIRDRESRERGNLRRDGGTDVGAHDHGGRLVQVHDPDVDETDDEHGRHARALDEGGRHGADADVNQPPVGSLPEQILDAAGRELLNVRGEQLDAYEEYPRPRQKLDEK